VFFGGKGGVGKTTCAMAAALRWAWEDPDAPLLLVSTDPAHSLADCLAGGSPPRNLHVEELNAAVDLVAFRAQHGDQLHEITRRGTFLDDRDIDRFLSLSLPGLDEFMAVLVLSRQVSTGRYRTVLVDTAPSGHTLRLLALPSALRQWLDLLDTLLAKHRYMKEVFRGSYAPDALDRFILDLAAELEALDRLLRDPDRCRFVPVALAEPLVLEETLDLAHTLHAAGIATPELVINRLYPDHPCPTCRTVRAEQSECLARYASVLQDIGRLWGLPVQPEEPRGIEALAAFWDGVMPIDQAVSSAATAPLPVRVEAPGPYPGSDQRLLIFCGKGGVGKTTLPVPPPCISPPPSPIGAPCCSPVTRPIPWVIAWVFPSDPSRLLSPRAWPRWRSMRGLSRGYALGIRRRAAGFFRRALVQPGFQLRPAGYGTAVGFRPTRHRRDHGPGTRPGVPARRRL